MEFFISGFLGTAYIVLAIVVTLFLAGRDDLEPVQKIVQIVLVWLIPIIGAIALWSMNKSHDEQVRPDKTFGGGPRDNSGAGSDGNH